MCLIKKKKVLSITRISSITSILLITSISVFRAKFRQNEIRFYECQIPFDSTKIRGRFFEFSRNKGRKSANFAFVSFLQYCKFNLGDDVFETIRTQLVSIDLLKHIENQTLLNYNLMNRQEGTMEK